MQEASVEACDAEWHGVDDPGLSSGSLMDAIDQQVRQICEQLTPQTCQRHVSLPDGVRVASVRRLEQPALQPFALERA